MPINGDNFAVKNLNKNFEFSKEFIDLNEIFVFLYFFYYNIIKIPRYLLQKFRNPYTRIWFLVAFVGRTLWYLKYLFF